MRRCFPFSSTTQSRRSIRYPTDMMRTKGNEVNTLGNTLQTTKLLKPHFCVAHPDNRAGIHREVYDSCRVVGIPKEKPVRGF
jgi:hypothetical protein